MPTIRTFTLQFATPLYPRQIPYLRGAIKDFALYHDKLLQKHNLQPDLFCNETESEEGKHKNLDRYPMIQYKIINRQAAVTGLQQGADALKLLWKHWEDLQVHDMRQVLAKEGSQVTEKEYQCKMQKNAKMYRIYHWLALNSDNEKRYREMQKLSDRVQLLEEILTRHIKKMTDDCGWQIKKEVKVFLGQISHIERNQYKNKSYLSFDCTFGCNLLLPEEIGLGNGPAFGFGKFQYLPVSAPKPATEVNKEQVLAL